MTRRALSIITGLLIAAVTIVAEPIGSAADTRQLPTFRGETNLVLVDAYPQRDGKIVEGLTKADFEIREDGKPQTVTNLEFVSGEGPVSEAARRDPNDLREMASYAANPHNRVFVAYLDTLQTTVEGSQRIRLPLVHALNTLVGPADLFGVMTPDMKPRDLTLARRMLSSEDQLARYWSWGTRNQSVQANISEVALSACFSRVMARGDDRTLDKVLIERRREDQTLSGLEALVAHLGSMREARSVVFLVSDGFLGLLADPVLFNSTEPSRSPARGRLEDADYVACLSELRRLALLDNQHRLREVIAAAERANVGVYPIAPNGLAAFDVGAASEPFKERLTLEENTDRMRTRVQSLVTLAENTDGIATVNRNDVGTGLQKVLDDLSSYYLLSYYSTDARTDSRFRRIEVKVRQPGVTIHARRGYVAGTSSARVSAGSPSSAPAGGVADAMRRVRAVRSEAELYAYGAVSVSELRVVVELASRLVGTSAWRSGGRVTVDVRTPTGDRVANATGTIEAGARAVALTIPLSTAGPLVIRSSASTGDASIEADPLTIDASSGVPGVPLLFRAAASPRAPLKPMADLQLRRTERLHIEWPLASTIERHSARVLTQNGQPLPSDIAVTDRTVDGQHQMAVDLGLAALGEGEYVIELTVDGPDRKDQRWMAFRVVR